MMTVVWDGDGSVVVKLPDDPEASAQVSGPTARGAVLDPRQMAALVEALPRDAASHLRSLLRQHGAAAIKARDTLTDAADAAAEKADSASRYVTAVMA